MPTISTEYKSYLTARFKSLEDARQDQLAWWKDAKDYLLPDHGRGLSGATSTEVNKGSTGVRDKLLDATTEHAVSVAASGMMSGMTSQARPWFKFGLRDRDMNRYLPFRVYLDAVTEIVRNAFSASNIYNGLHHNYLELLAFCGAGNLLLEDPRSLLRLDTYTAGEYYLGSDGTRVVDTFALDIWLTVRQIVDLFGRENCSATVGEKLDKGLTEDLVRVTYLIEPNGPAFHLPGRYPVRGVHYEYGLPEQKVLRLGGYYEFPAITPRWHVISNSVYGTGQGRLVLPDAKMLQEMQRVQLITLKKICEPAMVASHKQDILRTFPGGVTTPNDALSGGKDALRPLYVPDATAIRAMGEAITATQDAIRRGYFNQLFLMLSTANIDRMTATEVAERHEEKLVMLGPVLERMQTELLNPLVERAYLILHRLGMLPDPPPDLQDAELDIEYVSILAQAEKAVGVRPMEQLTAYLGNLVGAKPDALDNVDFDKVVQLYAERVGAPAEIMVMKDAVAKIRAERAKQVAMQQALAGSQQAAQTGQMLANSPIGKNSVLDMLLGNVSGNPTLPVR